MGLSNYLPTSAIAKPGVCTSSTRPASPYDGQVIYETDTDKTLVWNGSAWVYLSTSTANPPGLELVKTQSVGSGVTSVTVTDAFSSNYENYFVTWTGGTLSSLQLITVYMGSAPAASGYYGAKALSNVGGTFIGGGDNNGTQWLNANAGDATIADTAFYLYGPYASRRTYISSTYWERNGASSVFGTYGGFLDNTTSYTSFTLDPFLSVTMTGGTIRVYGLRN